ncbi:MAG: hypothetical protein YHS30scaffold324_15 [Catenulispora phage 69_17]|nr:MAG: hypothetical protein YHS30scaffold324_15 [Catenulispora phage 69_17]
MNPDETTKLFAPDAPSAPFVDPVSDEPNERVRATARRLGNFVSAGPPPAATLLCTGCVIDAKQAVLLGKKPDEIPEPLPGVVMVQGMLLCEIRHTINVGAPSLLIPQPGQVPGGLG